MASSRSFLFPRTTGISTSKKHSNSMRVWHNPLSFDAKLALLFARKMPSIGVFSFSWCSTKGLKTKSASGVSGSRSASSPTSPELFTSTPMGSKFSFRTIDLSFAYEHGNKNHVMTTGTGCMAAWERCGFAYGL